MKKKIIFVSEALWCGGIETALINLLNHIDYSKYDVSLLVVRNIFDFNMKERINPKCRLIIIDRRDVVTFDKRYPYYRIFGLTEECVNPSKLHKIFKWVIPSVKWIENRLFIDYIRKMMKDEIFDTAIIYSDVVAEHTIRAIKARKYLMFYHHGAMRHVYHDEIGYRKSEKIIAVSENQAKALGEFVPRYAKKITVIHNLTDVDGLRKKAEMPLEDKFVKEHINIVSCGRVSHEKGMDIAVKACAELVKRGFDDIRWWIVGGGPAEQEVKNIISELHMEEHVKMVGMKGNPYPYIKQADLYVQPSRFEGYPLTILEALILGQPVISTNNNGAKEIIQNEKTGILCTIDEKDISDKIEMVLKKQKLVELRKEVRKIDFENENQKYMKMIEKLL